MRKGKFLSTTLSVAVLTISAQKPITACSCISIIMDVDTTFQDKTIITWYDEPNTASNPNPTRVPSKIDTIYRTELLAELKLQMDTNSIVFIGEIDSVGPGPIENYPDTSANFEITPEGDTIFFIKPFIDPFEINETFRVKINRILKGVVPDNNVWMTYRRYNSSCFYHSHRTAMGFSFINFSNKIDSISDLDLHVAGPCYGGNLDPYGILINNGVITHNDYPGLSVTLDELLYKQSHIINARSVPNQMFSVRDSGFGPGKRIMLPYSSSLYRIYVYNTRGIAVYRSQSTGDKSHFLSGELFTAGIYILTIINGDAKQSKMLVF